MAAASAPNPVAPVQASMTTPQSKAPVPFRVATIERCDILPGESGSIAVSQNNILRTVEGTGYLYGIVLRFTATAVANAAAVTFAEDGPWNAYSTVSLADPTGELLNAGGWYLYLINLCDAQYANRLWDGSTNTTLFNQVTGAVGAGGSFTTVLRVPTATNRRDLLGIVGNQDRSIRYFIRTDVAASSVIYGVAPTTLPPFTIEKQLESYAVPPLSGPWGPNSIIPNGFGTLQYHTVSASEAVPLGGSTINHYNRRIGNTVRWLALVFRSNNSRVTADANPPTRIQMKVGDTDYFNEPYWYRRALMYERYGFEFPAGVALYDALHDFSPRAGFEVGDDWYNTDAVNTMQFLITYPAAFGSTANSLNLVTSDMIMVNQPSGS